MGLDCACGENTVQLSGLYNNRQMAVMMRGDCWAGFAYPAADSVQHNAAIDVATDVANDAANDAAIDAAIGAAIDAANDAANDAAIDAANDYRRAGLPFPLRRQGWVAFLAA